MSPLIQIIIGVVILMLIIIILSAIILYLLSKEPQTWQLLFTCFSLLV